MLHSLRLQVLLASLALTGAANGQSLVQADQNPALADTSVTTPPAHPLGAAAAPAPAVNPDSVYINPEVLPHFVGGDKAFIAYLSKSIRYPQRALQQRVSGRVFVNFVLDATGKVQDAHVVSGPGNGLNDEALRLVWLMPPWEPARVNGQPVRVSCTVPISFTTER